VIKLTFGQEQGLEPLPSQAALGTISQETRAYVWAAIQTWIEAQSGQHSGFSSSARGTATRWWVRYKHRMIDEAPSFSRPSEWRTLFKAEVTGDFPAPFNFVQFLLQDRGFTNNRSLVWALEESRAAYRAVEDHLVPFTSQEEHRAIVSAFSEAAAADANGARAHLETAACELTSGNWAGAAHESISAVESAARKACGNDQLDLSAAIAMLKRNGSINHAALAEMLKKLYAYGSDEKGVRHSLGAAALANVGEGEAMLVFGVSASAVSYLLRLGQDNHSS
jgi:hypothetical protein